MFTMTNKIIPSDNLEYIITETGQHDSLDPLDADQTHNLPVARMIYATPIEVDKYGKLSSSVLSDFYYDEVTKQLIFSIKKNIYFSDNTPIVSKDIVFAILRMLYFRPNFPVIKEIVGKDDWLKQKFPLRHLPLGITFDENKIKILFKKDVPNSLFRFTLELFSIIPYKTINLDTGLIKDKEIATSGLYTISSKYLNKISFNFRSNLLNINNFPKRIEFKYKNISFLTEEDFSSHSIISGNEADLLYSKKKDLFKKVNLQMLPSARFATIRFNTQLEPFKNRLCRLYFSEELRKTIKSYNKDITAEGSLFTELIPGYVEYTNLKKSLYALSENEEKNCLEIIRSSKFNLATSDNNTLKIGFELILKTLENLKVNKISIHSGLSNSQITESFASGKLSLVSGASGFWALDPAGDVEMYFTKNLHKTLQYVWEDDILYNLIEKIDHHDIKKSLEAINKHIFLDSRLGVYMHFRRFYATNKSFKIERTGTSISVSPPWLLNLVPLK